MRQILKAQKHKMFSIFLYISSQKNIFLEFKYQNNTFTKHSWREEGEGEISNIRDIDREELV